MATNGTHVLLTGASSGIGLETARLLCERGYSVWGTSRDVKRLPSLPNFHSMAMDMTDTKSIRDGFAQVLKEAERVDVLINNAGAGEFGPIEMQPGEIAREQFELLVQGPLELIRLVLPDMRGRKNGRIINVSSIGGRFAIPYLGPYSAAKAAMISLTQSLRMELAGSGVRIIDLQPGDIATNFHTATRRVELKLEEKEGARIETAWKTIERNMAVAPPAGRVAEAILKIIRQPNPPPVVMVGSFFQARLGPVLARLAPPRVIEWVLRRYYRI